MARKPKLDTVLAGAVETARLALREIADDAEIGEHCGAAVEGERLVTHRFVSLREGYRGWTWFVTLARIPRAKAKDATVCELGIIPDEQALLAPAWVPWADRLAQEEIDAAQQEAEIAESGETPAAEENSEHVQLEAQTTSANESVSVDNVELAEVSVEDTDATTGAAQPARRPVRRRRTAQRTAARRRAAVRNRSRKTSD